MQKSRKGNILLPAISVIAIIAVIVAGYFFSQNQVLKQKELGKREPTPGTVPAPQNPNGQFKVAGWKTYTNEKLNFSVKYSPAFAPQEAQLVGNTQQLALIAFGSIKNNGFDVEVATGDSIGYYKNQIFEQSGQAVDKEENFVVDNTSGTKLTFKQIIVTEKVDAAKAIIKKYGRDYIITSQASDLDQILSTFKFLDSTNRNSDSNIKTYTSAGLGISFNYLQKQGSETIVTKEVGNKIYIYSDRNPYIQGQWVEVFTKPKNYSLADAIQQKILTGYSSTDCIVSSPATYKTSSNFYPSSYQTATIGVPKSQNDDLSTLLPKWQKCHEPYVTENGISYFLMDSNHSDKFVYFSIGQYPIGSGVEGQTWQDTIKFL